MRGERRDGGGLPGDKAFLREKGKIRRKREEIGVCERDRGKRNSEYGEGVGCLKEGRRI